MEFDDDEKELFKTSFTIETIDHELPFTYEKSKDGTYYTCASNLLLEIEEGAGHIKIEQRNIPYLREKFRGPPEVIRNGSLKIIQPTADGSSLVEESIGFFECKRCGEKTYVPQNGKFVEPFECENVSCGRKGAFKPSFPVELTKPIWKLPNGYMECSAVEVYRNICDYIREYLVLKPEEYHLMSLWVMASWLSEDFDACPYLLFIAPKESGKSQAMRILDQLAYRAFLAISVTPAALFRAIELWGITLLIDEAEYQVKSDTESGQALYGCLNGGYKRNSYALRTEGDARIPTAFDVYGFKAIASTRAFLATLESRSIIINMTQGIPAKILIDENKAAALRSELLYFRFVTLGKLVPIQPVSTSGRLMEMFTPLYTVAQIFKGLGGMKTVISYGEITKILDAKLRELEVRRSDEEQESTEAIIINAVDFLIGEASHSDEPEKIWIKDIVNYLGWTNDNATADIGKKLKAMGIKTRRVSKGTIIEHQKPEIKERLNEMTKRYFKNDNMV